MSNRVLQAAPDLGSLSGQLRELVGRCLAKDAGQRPDSHEVLLRLLERPPAPPQGDFPVPGAYPAPPLTAAPRGRVPLVLAAVAGAAVVVAGAGVGVWAITNDRSPARPLARSSVVPAADILSIPGHAGPALQVAGQAFESYASFDYRTFDADANRAQARLTGKIKQDYVTRLPSNRANAIRQKVVIRATVIASGVVFATADRVVVLSFGDLRSSQNGGRPQVTKTSVRIGMGRGADGWLVESMTPMEGSPASAPSTDSVWPRQSAQAMLTAARDCVKAMFTASPATVDARTATVDRCATGEFADQWRASSGQIRAMIRKTGATMEPGTVEIGLAAAREPDHATVLAFAEAVVRPRKGDTTNQKSRLRVEMTRVGGRWLVSKLTAVP